MWCLKASVIPAILNAFTRMIMIKPKVEYIYFEVHTGSCLLLVRTNPPPRFFEHLADGIGSTAFSSRKRDFAWAWPAGVRIPLLSNDFLPLSTPEQ